MDRDMVRAAEFLCPRVRELAVSARQGGEELSAWLRREYGMPVRPDGEGVTAAVRFDETAPGGGGRELSLYCLLYTSLAAHSAVCVPTMMPYITAFFMPRTRGDRPDVIPDGCVNFAFLGQFADTPRDTVFTTEYSVRTAMEAVYGLLGVDRGVPEVWGSVYDIRELLHSTVCLMDGRSPLEVSLPGPLELLKKPLLKAIRGTVIEKVLRDQDVLRDGM